MLVVVLSIAFAQEPASTWTLDPGASALHVRVNKDPDTVASGLAHDHVVVAAGWSGKVTWGGPNGCAGEVRVPVADLVVDPPEWRAKTGAGDPLTEKQRRQIRGSMLGKDQLHADAHPFIAFQATSCGGTSGRVPVKGKLTIRGVTREITVPMDVSVEGGRFRARGTFTARATDFGFQPYSAFMGAVRNRDEMTFTVDLVGVGTGPS